MSMASVNWPGTKLPYRLRQVGGGREEHYTNLLHAQRPYVLAGAA